MTEEKSKTVKNMFSSIAEKYDRANSFITFGLDRLWRKKLVRLSSLKKDSYVLDCATGTGVLAQAFLKELGENGRVTAIDFCKSMLNQIRIQDSRFDFKQADVMNLPFSDQTFDITTIAYGLRNLPDIENGLKEMARVTKSGGYLMILETGKPSNPFLSPFLSLYFKWIVPLVGGLVTGQRSAYKYLNQTSSQFPSGQKLINIFKNTGCFKTVSCYPLMGGASFIYKAQVCHT